MYNWASKFPGLVSGSFPTITAKNASGPTAQDGTPFTADFINDFWGWMQDILASAELTPNGDPEMSGSSQILKALKIIFATLESPELTGTPTAPTAPVGTNNTQIATMAAILNNVVDALDNTSTTKALSAAQGKELQDTKAPKASPTFTGTVTLPEGGATKVGSDPVAVVAITSDRWDYNLPVGSYVFCIGRSADLALNSPMKIVIENGVSYGGYSGSASPSGTLLSGTWRSCGHISPSGSHTYVSRRVA